MKMTVNADSERFQSGANQYAVYLETPEGRLRSDLAFANLQDFLPLQAKSSLCALDLGCGPGATAIRLARLGIHVTLLDSSPAMLNIATIRVLCCAVRSAPCGIHRLYCPFSYVTRQAKYSKPLSKRAIWLQRKMASALSGDKSPCTEAGCGYLRPIACE